MHAVLHTLLYFVIVVLYVGFYIFKGRWRIILARTLHKIFGGSKVDRGGGSIISVDNTVTSGLDNGELLPYSVTQRIETCKTQQLPWTSNLSVNEWVLLKSLKLKPTGMVSGFAHFKLALSLSDEIYSAQSYMSYQCAKEIQGLENTLRSTCQKALDRLQEEARLHGAHAVVGVKLVPRWPDKDGHQIEYTATGTAVVMEGHEATDKPILCTTSVIEFAKLIEAGTIPMGIALGVGIYFNTTSFSANWKSQSWSNQEIPEFANVTYSARNVAIEHMKKDAKKAGGAGVLAFHTKMHVHQVETDRNNDTRIDHIIEYKSLGTIIGAVDTDKPNIKMIMPMNNKKNKLEEIA